MVISLSFVSSCRELKRDIIILNLIVSIFLLAYGGNFLMNLSLGPGVSFQIYVGAFFNPPTIPRGRRGRGLN